MWVGRTGQRHSEQLPRRLSIVVALVCLVSVVVIIALGWWAMSTVDHDAEEREMALAEEGLEESFARIPREQESSTVWDEAVLKVKANDQAWMRENMGEWMGSYFGHDFVFILNETGSPIHAMKEGVTLPPASYEEDRIVIEPLVGQLRQRMQAPAPQTHRMRSPILVLQTMS